MKKLIAWMLIFAMAFVPAGAVFAEDQTEEEPVEAVEIDSEAEEAPEEEYEYEDVLGSWNPDAPALDVLIDYVETVTDENSEDYIPPVDRIAIFDMDGTLYGELFPTYLEYYMLAWRILKDPSIDPDEEMLTVGRTLRDCALDKSFPEDMPMQHAIQAARAYAGLTLNEFADFVTTILLRDVDGFEGMTYGEAFYVPMIEVIDYLNENDFKVYVCSGSDRFICRTLLEGMVDVPAEHIIGMDVALEATNQGETDGLDYVYQEDDDVVRTDQLLIKNLKTNKVLQIAQEIGRQPVLSFGNSSGDVSMHNYVINNNKYKSAAFMLIADDEERDYGNTEKTRELGEKWEESGYTVISMKDDFLTIYGEDVKKTGSFHWEEELAEDRVPAAKTEESADTGLIGKINSHIEKAEELGHQLEESIPVEQLFEEGGFLYDLSKKGEQVIDLVEGIAGGDDAGDAADDDPFEGFLMVDDEVYQTSRATVRELNKEQMDEGDVQIVTSCVAKNAVPDDNTVRQFGMFTQQNFALDGSDLKMVGAARDVFLFTQTKNEDGSYTVTDIKRTEDGEKYQESLAAMCEEMDITVDEFNEETKEIELWEMMDLLGYLDQHPEVQRMEYMGELMTKDELMAVEDELFTEFYG